MKTYHLLLAAATLLAGSAVAQKAILPDGVKVPADQLKVSTTLPQVMKPAAEAPYSGMQMQQQAKSPALAQASEHEGFAFYNYNLADKDFNYYVYQYLGYGGIYYRATLHGTSDDLSHRDLMYEWPKGSSGFWDSGEFVIDGGCMVGDEYWVYVSKSYYMSYSHMPNGIYRLDLESGQLGEMLYDHTWAAVDPETRQWNNVLYEMSYDPYTDYVYALQKDAEDWMGLVSTGIVKVVRIDPHNPAAGWRQIGQLDTNTGYYYGMACDNGQMYLIKQEKDWTLDAEGNVVSSENYGADFYTIDLEEFGNFTQDNLTKIGRINQGFLKIEYYQTMEFDHSNHTLWWFGVKDDASGTGFLTNIDLKTAETGDIQTLPGIWQYLALAIPYQLADDNAPSYVKDLTFKAGDNGDQTVKFDWTNPDKDFQLNALTSLSSIKVYRDGELLKTLTPSGIGQADTWTDTNVPSGEHIYKFTAVNGKGDGLYKERKMFVGRDVPGKPVNVQVKSTGTKAVISWEPSARGSHDGWYDKETVTYNVVRMPGSVRVATDTKETSINDEVTEYKGYYYIITPKNADGTGLTAMSEVSPYGPDLDIPYVNTFDTEDNANVMTIIDGNQDGWKWTYNNAVDEGYRSFTYGYCLNQADDYIVTPAMKFEAGKQYEIRFDYASSTFTGTEEKLEVRQGVSNRAEDQTELLATFYGYPEYFGETQHAACYIMDPSKGNYLSIRCTSEGNQGWVQIFNVMVREYSATDLSVQNLDGSQYAYIGKDNPYVVTVRNEGNASVKTGKAYLIDNDDESVLAQANVGVIKAGETKDVTVIWVPTTKGDKVNISARVELEGDTYPADNRWDQYLTVTTAEGEPATWVEVKNYRTDRKSTGWRPLYTMLGYSDCQTIYALGDIGIEECKITGISYEYEPAAERADLANIPVEIYLAETDKYFYELDSYYAAIQLPESSFTKVLTTNIDASGDKIRNIITMLFDTPFEYSGKKNLCVRVLSDAPATADNPNWRIYYEELFWPTVDEGGPVEFHCATSTNNGSSFKLSDQVPYIKIGYITSSGITGEVTLGAKFRIEGNTVYFDGKQDNVKVYDLSGKLIKNVDNAESIVLPRGFYSVVARTGANILTSKVKL